MSIIDHKYVGFLSNRLPLFKRVNNKTYNFRCPLCGDSKRNTHKTRGYIYQKKDHLLYYCHNCGASMSFANFLKSVDVQLHTEYLQEKFMEKNNAVDKKEPDITSFKKPVFQTNSPLRVLKKISELDHDHPANKLAHYAKEATDIEYQFPFGWGEIEGIHNRTNFDLSRHEEYSGKNMKYFDEETKEKLRRWCCGQRFRAE